MPIYMRHAIDVKPFVEGTDVLLGGTGFHLPAAVDVQHEFTNKAVTLTFRLSGDVNGDRDPFHLEIQLLVPAVQHTDFLLG